MIPLSKRTRRGLAEAVLQPLILGMVVAGLLVLGQWLGNGA